MDRGVCGPRSPAPVDHRGPHPRAAPRHNRDPTALLDHGRRRGGNPHRRRPGSGTSSRHRARRLDRRCRLQHTAGRAGLTGGLGCVRRDPPRHSHRVLRRPRPLSRPGAVARLRDQRHPAAQSAVLRHGFELHVVPLDSTAGHHPGDEYRVHPAPVLHLGDCGGHRGRGRPRRGESRRKQKGSARHLLVPVTAGSLGDHRYDHASPRPARHRERRPMHRPPRIPPLPLSQRRTRQTIRRRKRRRHRGTAPRHASHAVHHLHSGVRARSRIDLLHRQAQHLPNQLDSGRLSKQ